MFAVNNKNQPFPYRLRPEGTVDYPLITVYTPVDLPTQDGVDKVWQLLDTLCTSRTSAPCRQRPGE